MPPYEEDYLSEAIANMYNCRIYRWPVDIFFHVDFDDWSTGGRAFYKCVEDVIKTKGLTYMNETKKVVDHYILPSGCHKPEDSNCEAFKKPEDSKSCFMESRKFENMKLTEIEQMLTKSHNS